MGVVVCMQNPFLCSVCVFKLWMCLTCVQRAWIKPSVVQCCIGFEQWPGQFNALFFSNAPILCTACPIAMPMDRLLP